MLRLIMRKLRSGVRAVTGAQEDRASIWGGIQMLQGEIRNLRQEMDELLTAVDQGRILQGRAMAAANLQKKLPVSLHDVEFKVFSQFGDDGIIQYLLQCTGARPDTFIEFGVTDYTEANTRFLVLNDNWRGLVMDGDPAMVERIKRDRICVFHGVVPVAAFIDRDNINGLFRQHGFEGPIGLLSVDIDGNDYWVWEAITAVDPVVVVCEYNSVFGRDRAITVPYDPQFERRKAHYSNLYYGASLKALCLLANRKGYAFVGSNSNGNNAYFVKRERLGALRELTPEEGWVESRFHESMDREGRPTFLSGAECRKLIAECPVYDVGTKVVVPFQA